MEHRMNMFRERGGKVSLTRVMSFMVVVAILAVFIAWNVKRMITGGEFVTLGLNEVYLIAIALGAKVAQNVFGEKIPKGEERPETNSTSVKKQAEPVVNGPG
jgi:hypothetical protein